MARTLALAALLAALATAVAGDPPAEGDGRPVRLGVFSLPAGVVPLAMDHGADVAYVGAAANDAAELYVVGTGDPASPRLRWTLEVGADVVQVSATATRVYLGTRGAAPQLLIVDAAQGRVVGRLETHADADAVRVAGNAEHVVLGTTREGLHVVDVRDPAHPRVEQTLDWEPSLAVEEPPSFAKPYDAGGPVLARHFSASTPGATVLLARSQPASLQVVAGLEDDLVFGFGDANGDGRYRVACLGDSNTFALRKRGWCRTTGDLVWNHRYDTRNDSALGAKITGGGPTHGPAQVRRAIAAGDVDAVILAFGTNDLLHTKRRPRAILSAYRAQAAAAEAAGLTVFVALTPPVFSKELPISAGIRELNVLIRGAFPEARVIDFHDGFSASDFVADGFHLNAKGHAKRARRALSKLAQPTPGTPGP